jgi:hypothetical protein
VLILDEAHLRSGEQLDEVRMLSNHDMDCRRRCLHLATPEPQMLTVCSRD